MDQRQIGAVTEGADDWGEVLVVLVGWRVRRLVEQALVAVEEADSEDIRLESVHRDLAHLLHRLHVLTRG